MATGSSRGLGLMAMILALACAACGRDSPPRGFRPASAFDCPKLTGDFRVTDADIVRRVLPDLVGQEGMSTAYLSVSQGNGGNPQVALRRDAADILQEAATLRLGEPDRYLEWRRHVLARQGDATLKSGVPTGESVIAALGPAVSVTRNLGLGECSGGWIDVWPMRAASPGGGASPPRWIGVRLSRDKAGALLVRSDIYVENNSGFVFFGQGITYNTYERSEWHRLEPASLDRVRFRIEPAELPLVPDRRARERFAIAARDAVGGLRRDLTARLGKDVHLSLLRQVQFEPSVLTLPPNVVRVEVAGYFDGDEDSDPFGPLLRESPKVSDIEVRRRARMQDGRRYLLLRFSYTL